MRHLLLSVVLACALPALARAQEPEPSPTAPEQSVYLRDGSVLHGQILDSGNGVLHLRTLGGDLTIREENVLRVDDAASPEPALPATPAPRRLRPWIAGWGNAILPGAGYAYEGRFPAIAALYGAFGVELFGAVEIYDFGGVPATAPDTRINRMTAPLELFQDTWFFGVYDAYRYARLSEKPGSRHTPTPGPDLPQLLLSPFRPQVLARPVVAIPLLVEIGVLGVLLASDVKTNSGDFFRTQGLPLYGANTSRGTVLADNVPYDLAEFWGVGVGEESLFRGVIQTSLQEWIGPTWGWAGASVLFAAAHLLNPGQANLEGFLGRVPFGFYAGWIYDRDDHDLSTCVALHTWYDFSLGLFEFLTDPKDNPLSVRVTVPLPF